MKSSREKKETQQFIVWSFFLISLLPYFIFRSDNEFYLTTILWEDKLKNTMDFFSNSYSMQKLSFLVTLLKTINFNPLFSQFIQFLLYLLSMLTILYCIREISKIFRIKTFWIFLFFGFLLILNPQSSISASRFITDYLHPRYFSFAILILSISFYLKGYFNLFLLSWGFSFFSHPITCILWSISLLPFLFYTEIIFLKTKISIQKKVYIHVSLFLIIFLYFIISRTLDQNSNLSSPFVSLDFLWKSVLEKTMPFIFTDYIFKYFDTYGIETQITFSISLILSFLLKSKKILFLNLYIALLIWIFSYLAIYTNFLIFYQIQPFRMINIFCLLIVFQCAYLLSHNFSNFKKILVFALFSLFLFYRPTESFNYQIIKFFGLTIFFVFTFFVYIKPINIIYLSLISILSWGTVLKLDWSDQKYYEIFGKAFTIQNYNEWEDLLDLKNWFQNNTSCNELIYWNPPDDRSSLLRLLIGAPTYVGLKDGGITLYSRNQAMEFNERLRSNSSNYNEAKYIISKTKINKQLLYTVKNEKYYIYKN